MKYTLLTTVFIFMLHIAFAQKDQRWKTDSLYRVLVKQTGQDPSRVIALSKYARAIRHDSTEKAMQYAEEGLALSKRIKNEYLTGILFYTKAKVLSSRNNYTASNPFCDSAMEIFMKTDSTELLHCLSSKAENYLSMGNNSEAIDIFHKVISIAEKKDAAWDMGVAYGNIGNIYWGLDMNKEALDNYEQSLTYFKKIKDSLSIAALYQNSANCYTNLGNTEKGKKNQETAIQLFQHLGRTDMAAWNQTNLAVTLVKMKRCTEAINLLHQSRPVLLAGNNKIPLAMNYTEEGNLIAMLADSSVNPLYTYSTALIAEQKGLALAKEIKDIRIQGIALKYLTGIYQKQKDYKSALDANLQYISIKDSLAGKNKIQEIAIKEVQFSNDKKEAIATADHIASMKRQTAIRNFIVITGALIIGGSLFLFLLYKKRRDAKTLQKEAELKAEISDTEMKALKAQMNPHFIFNSLNSISDYIAKNNTHLADEYLTKFAKLMRLILENSEQKEIPLALDLKALELYMQLEALRMNNKFTYEIKIDETIDTENTMVPPLILQPFVENSIWHGIAQKDRPGKITVSIKRENNNINCIVEDDGVGREKASLLVNANNKQSLGMKITKQRLDVLNKVKNAAATILVSDLQQGTRVEVKLPLEVNF